ncbi:16S rRNA (cytosine(1402)-N(4))-methyltransferase RsmH [Buchnera aphidicola]|uniref:Ribosomal RNA small subunit methyltransferase H n=1 Tax=Buchnera aphidicola (Sarucallis kahawaluokalani) TaxID=1241878 RepID=A0A4D6Y9U7_9GAMM|nr:16S rRNA (cytosine(1402)-N(4))-methyltransferase RsmH [Buchnera aphidicola]QCI25952.1 16S rRNA (cytosine(1402)-N(4))-methyltransferase RsmH [Buchnera aphidicola (Sarucallis kahawaluokalani)]
MKKKIHKTVLLHETIQSLNIKNNGIYFDGTFGAGGHSLKILKHLGKKGKLYAMDKDPQAVEIGKTIHDPRFSIIHGSFSNIDMLLKKYNLYKKFDGILLDLGVSSMQIMSPNRGFSFNANGPLDMRMDPNHGISAATWINSTTKKKIYYVLKYFGEEKFAKKIANHIIKYRKNQPITTTHTLANIINNIIPRNKNHKNPATKSFQAIRIFINQELRELHHFLEQIFYCLNDHGRIAIISFHSLEDRIVKHFFQEYSKKKNIPINIPVEENIIKKNSNIKLKIINRIFPSIKEIKKNIKSRSAILRTAERI